MGYEFHISWRQLRAKSGEAFISLISLMSAGGVTLGVTALIVVMAVMTGFESDLKSRILAVSPHAWVLRHGGPMEEYEQLAGRLRDMEDVRAAAPFVHGQVMARSAASVSGVVLKGLDPDRVGRRSGFQYARLVSEGSLEALGAGEDPDNVPGIILGRELAKTLKVGAGDLLHLTSPESGGGGRGLASLPRMMRYRVLGILETGMYEYDNVLAWMHISEARKLFGMGSAVTGVELALDDPLAAREAAREISSRLGFPYWARDWSRTNENLFAALKMQKTVISIILSLIVLVAAFNIASTLVMSVIDRKKEIAILRAMGATRRGILRIFVYNGLLIGATGAFLGLALSGALCYLLSRYQFIQLDPEIYPLATMPVDMRVSDVLLVTGGALLVSFLATLYPAWRASRLDPVEIIRYG
ncbi:MAG: lipoprotein-releasing ABC transporter permease subunit [Desulfatibacillaceae bacterium]